MTNFGDGTRAFWNLRMFFYGATGIIAALAIASWRGWDKPSPVAGQWDGHTLKIVPDKDLHGAMAKMSPETWDAIRQRPQAPEFDVLLVRELPAGEVHVSLEIQARMEQ